MVSGSRVGVGKLFEELAFHSPLHHDGEPHMPIWRLYSDGRVVQNIDQQLCPQNAKVATVSTLDKDLTDRQPYALKSDKQTEGGYGLAVCDRGG